jgi:methylase of polypeptide subunit release factors
VAVEIEDAAGPSISAAATAAGFTGVAVHPDLAGRDRVVSGRRP